MFFRSVIIASSLILLTFTSAWAVEPCDQVLEAHGFIENSAKLCDLPPLDEVRAKQEAQEICGSRYSPRLAKNDRVIGYSAVIPMIREQGGEVAFCSWFKDAWGDSLTK